MAKILCVEDSSEFFIYLTSVLKDHVLTQAESIADAFNIVQTGRDSFDMVLLDISLPDGNGMKILPDLKDSFKAKAVPIIILSTDDDIISKVAAFGIGADDYISKPPNSSELRARVDARLRAVKSYQQNTQQVQLGDLYIDSNRMCVELRNPKVGNQQIELTPFEFKILKILCGRPGQVFSREQLIDQVWGVGKYVTERTVDAHVSHLRKKISESTVKVETVLSAGYKATMKDSSSD
ncbi:response regulator transcription factor [Bdellovibrio sp. SKB1291214]|uniref:response regulator transcription factor n=1 Tax=Bdellovibrio sp. SKB1291214 TaxID=1732569 RepID=UPI000B51B2D4|nr:response regulator transcription factor [Bdellovibrio sp. SKB1291214]UYL10028.1 response regulator transcription factor [Bdellovibrio sp. SKB1291214]